MTDFKIEKFEGAVFHIDAVISKGDNGVPAGPMPRIKEAFNYLQSEGYKIILATENVKQAAKILKQHGLTDTFIHEGILQIVQLKKSPKHHHDKEPLVYYEGLKKLSIKSPKKLLAIASNPDDIRSARMSGITNVIGYAGSPDIEFGQVSARRDALTRDIRMGSGTPYVIENYADLPSIMFGLSPKL